MAAMSRLLSAVLAAAGMERLHVREPCLRLVRSRPAREAVALHGARGLGVE